MPAGGIARQIVGEIAHSKTKGKAYVNELSKLMPEQFANTTVKTQKCGKK